MRALIQRVSEASVSVDDRVVSSIGPGLLVLLGVSRDDGERDADWVADKVVSLRVFPDQEGRMNEPLGNPVFLKRVLSEARRQTAASA